MRNQIENQEEPILLWDLSDGKIEFFNNDDESEIYLVLSASYEDGLDELEIKITDTQFNLLKYWIEPDMSTSEILVKLLKIEVDLKEITGVENGYDFDEGHMTFKQTSEHKFICRFVKYDYNYNPIEFSLSAEEFFKLNHWLNIDRSAEEVHKRLQEMGVIES